MPKFGCSKKLSTFSEISIAIAMGINISKVKKNVTRNRFNMYQSIIFKLFSLLLGLWFLVFGTYK